MRGTGTCVQQRAALRALLKSPSITTLPLGVRGRDELALRQEAGVKSPKEEVRMGPTPRDRSRLNPPFLPQPTNAVLGSLR